LIVYLNKSESVKYIQVKYIDNL